MISNTIAALLHLASAAAGVFAFRLANSAANENLVVENATMSSIVATPVHLANEYDAIPLPAYFFPNGHFDVSALTDDDIMAIPPHVMVHILRTNAQNGLQVISPRQVPSTTIVKRVVTTSPSTFVHLAGSDAARKATWPVPKGSRPPVVDEMEEEPMMKLGAPLAHRTPASVDPLVHIVDDVVNPVHRRWIKARANVDLQMQGSIGGDGEALAECYEKRFGAESGSLMQDPGLVATVQDDLQRHAIVTDNNMARQLAPIQARRVIAVAVSTSTTDALGECRAFDWTCARVTAGNKFYLTVVNEGHSLTSVSTASVSSVGEMLVKPMARTGSVIAYHPTPATFWSYAPETFALRPDPARIMTVPKLAPMVAEELAIGAAFVSPIVSAMAHKATVAWTRSRVDRENYEASAQMGPRDTFAGFYTRITSAIVSGTGVGKTAPKALRHEVYAALESADISHLAKMVRALTVLVQARDASEGCLTISEGVVSALATRLVSLDSYLHAHMSCAAVARGEDPDDWFASLAGMVPDHSVSDKPGSKGWAKMAVRFILSPPDSKWASLLGALRRRAIAALESSAKVSFSTVPDDTEGHKAALALAVKSAITRRKAAHMASYDGAALGSVLCARMAEEAGAKTLAMVCRIAAAGWTLRQRFLARVYVTAEEETAARPMTARTWVTPEVVPGTSARVRISTRCTPHSVYSDWRQKVASLRPSVNCIAPDKVAVGMISNAIRMMLPAFPKRGEEVFSGIEAELCYELDACKFACVPETLASALEGNLTMLHEDAVKTAMDYIDDARKFAADKAAAEAEMDRRTLGRAFANPSTSVEAPVIEESMWEALALGEGDDRAARNGWFWLTQVDATDGQYIIDQQLTVAGFNELMATNFESEDDFLAAFDAAEEAAASAAESTGDVFV